MPSQQQTNNPPEPTINDLGREMFGQDYIEPELLKSFDKMNPTHQKLMQKALRQQKEIQRYLVKQNEQQEDAALEARQKEKLKKEINDPKQRRDPLTETFRSSSQTEREREEVEKFLAQQSTSNPTQSESPTEYFQPEPLQGYKCMTEGHENRPAVMKLKHGGALGDLPDLSFCEECAFQFKMVPIMENKPSKILLKRLGSLANKLDYKGLYTEANIIDQVLTNLAKDVK